MSSVSAWIRRRLDSSGSGDGSTLGTSNEEAAVQEDEGSSTSIRKNSISWSRKGQRRQTEPPNITYVIETNDKGVAGRRARHLSIGDANAAGLPQIEEVGSLFLFRVNRKKVLHTNKKKNKVNSSKISKYLQKKYWVFIFGSAFV